MSQAKLAPISRQQHFQALLALGEATENRRHLAQILASWLVGQGTLPDALGMPPEMFRQMLAECFAGYPLAEQCCSGKRLDFSRMLEKQDLECLLRQHALNSGTETEWIIALIVAACLGSDHLWQDLGLWSRQELSAMIANNFPELKARNSKDMKWKKFLYKQLCEAEGLYVCRAPSCEVCQDYPACFGPEES